MRVLYVEDDPVAREFIQKGVENAGIEVDTAPDVATGVELSQTRVYDVLILDVMLPDGDELDLLADTLNGAFARVEEGANKLRQFTADAAHELRTPLTRARSRLEVTLDDPGASPEVLRKALQKTLGELRSLSEALNATLMLAESDAGIPSGQGAPAALRVLLRDVIEFYEPLALEQHVDLRLNAGANVEVPGVEAWLRQAFANLIQNALAHTRTRVAVVIGMTEEAVVVVTIEDDGRGIAPEDIPRIFDRFYRAKGQLPDGEAVSVSPLRSRSSRRTAERSRSRARSRRERRFG